MLTGCMFEELRNASQSGLVSASPKPKVSLALVSIIMCLAAEKLESSSSGFMLAQKYEIANFENMRFYMLPAIVIFPRARLIQIAF